MDNYVKGVKVIEIYDAANKELLVKYDDKHNIDKVISALNIKSWKETEKSIGMNPKYTIKFYCDTTNQDEEKDIKEITLYENGEYATIFITSPGGVKQNYKTSIDVVSQLIQYLICIFHFLWREKSVVENPVILFPMLVIVPEEIDG